MNYKLKISSTAYQETDDAFAYYEEQSEGIGEKFLECLEDAYSRLKKSPEYFSYIRNDKNIRDLKIKTFPFVIIKFWKIPY